MATITPEEMRRWSAEKMGYKISIHKDKVPGVSPPTFTYRTNYWSKTEGQIYWRPDTDMNQCFLVVERMRELGWFIMLHNDTITGRYRAGFDGVPGNEFARTGFDTNPALAILLAARATEGK